jgi:hypothetical protein
MNKAAALLVISMGQREALTVLARSSTAAHRQVQRAKVLLMTADGVANAEIAATVGVTPVTVRSWRSRLADEGLAKFAVVREGRGRKPGITPAAGGPMLSFARVMGPPRCHEHGTTWKC